MMSFPLEAGGARAGAFEGRRKIEAFVERVHARPGLPDRARPRRPLRLRT